MKIDSGIDKYAAMQDLTRPLTAEGPQVAPSRIQDHDSSTAAGVSDNPFANLLKRAIGEDHTAQQAVTSYASGNDQSLHQVMLSLQKADIQLSFLVSVRNKLLDAYREIMRMG